MSSNRQFGMLRGILLGALVGTQSVVAQAPAPPSKVDAKIIYAKLCAGCHGADAHGTQQGPGLAGNPAVRRRSAQSLRHLIQNGIPAAGMPSFDLPARRARCPRHLGCARSILRRLKALSRATGGWQTIFLWQGTMRLLPHGLRRRRADRSGSFECGPRNDGRPDSTGAAAARRADHSRLWSGHRATARWAERFAASPEAGPVSTSSCRI